MLNLFKNLISKLLLDQQVIRYENEHSGQQTIKNKHFIYKMLRTWYQKWLNYINFNGHSLPWLAWLLPRQLAVPRPKNKSDRLGSLVERVSPSGLLPPGSQALGWNWERPRRAPSNFIEIYSNLYHFILIVRKSIWFLIDFILKGIQIYENMLKYIQLY